MDFAKIDMIPEAKKVLKTLIEGNKMFREGKATGDISKERRNELLKGQKPIATVITCSDSRVVPEYIFNQGLGDLFIIRTAGEALDDIVLASIEYGVAHLKTPLLLILGHTSCGAVEASLQEGEFHGHLPLLIDKIKPSVEACKNIPHKTEDELKTDVIIENVLEIKESLPDVSEPVKQAIETKTSSIHAAVYNMETGEVLYNLANRSHKLSQDKEPHHL